MKKPLVLLVALALAFLAACSSSTSAITTVDPSTFLQKAAEPGVTLIDVRTPQEFAEGHVAGAINIDAEGPGFSTAIAELERDAAYALYCQSGRRSAMAASAMAGAAFTNITNLEGGFPDLQAAGATVTTE